jgi:orotidine-5'-phosphate decarboxylase
MGADIFQARERIVFPLDYATSEEAVNAAGMLRGRVGLFKVGLELFTAAGPAVVADVAERTGAGIFLDLKFHDIPATVRGAAAAAAALGVRFISVHAAGGKGMLEAAVEGAGGAAQVLAITVLTSLDEAALRELGMREDLTDPAALVADRAGLAREAGCSGVVCSGRELPLLKRTFGTEFTALVPGIRPEWYQPAGDDQARTVSPRQAATAGADFIVVGRPIRLADDPAAAADRTAEEIAAGLS